MLVWLHILGLRKSVRQSLSCITYKKAPKIWDTSPSRKLDKILSIWQITASCHWWPLVSGCPETVLGPILFLIFINDISHCIKYCTIRCFADDTRISKAITCEGDVKALQDDLDAVVEWSVNNNMTLHKDKFEYICHSATKKRRTTCAIFNLFLSSISTKHPWIFYPQFSI